MIKKSFKYETKSGKKIRLKDLLMLFSAIALCIISIVTVNSISRIDKTDTATKDIAVDATGINEDIPKAKLEDYQLKADSASESVYEISPVLPPLEFIKPVDGYIIKPFSKNDLIYSETMDDWRIHLGIDISCPIGSNVISAERGVVKKCGYDISLGNVVEVECDDYIIKYSSLSSEFAVSEGHSIAKGEVIGTSSDSCMSEICDEPHIHLEVIKSGEHIDPLEIIEFN